MIRSCVTISLVPVLRTGPWIYWDDLEISIPKAKAAGFDAIELFVPSGKAIEPNTLANLLDRHDIKLAAVGTGAGKVLQGLYLSSPDRQVRRQAVDYVKDVIDLAGPLGAPAIIGSMQGSSVKGIEVSQSLMWLRESLTELAERAAEHSVNLILEPLNRYETDLINGLGYGVEFIKTVRADNLALLADLFHMNIEEESISGAILEARGYIGHLHVADSNRRPLGMGHLHIEPIAQALRDIVYNGYASGEALPYPDPDRAAAQTLKAFQQYLQIA